MYNGDTIIDPSSRKTSGKPHLKLKEVYLNQ